MQSPSIQSSIQEAANKKNLFLLVTLRGLAVGGQIATIAFVQLWLDIPLPLIPMSCVLLFLIALNLVSFFRSRQPETVITSTELFVELLLDVAALTAQLYLSGGATNPFVSLLLVQAVLGAVLLPPRLTWILLVAASGCFILLTTTYWPIRLVPGWFAPLPGQDGHYDLHAYGLFVSFLLAAVLLVLFVTRINGNLRDRDRHLSELRQQSAEEEHIVRMGLLASGAAHELGTPLGTLSVILNDWGRLPALRKDPDMVSELGEMNAALERCKDIVSHILLAAGEARGEHFERTTLAGFIDDAVAEWQETRSPPYVDYNADVPNDISIASDTVIRQILLNVFDNALEASPKWVGIEASKEGDVLIVTVSDKGKGFAPEILANFGKPYQSTKDRAGSGLGLFLVVNVLRKLGGKATARNNRYGGASVELCLPIEALAIDAGRIMPEDRPQLLIVEDDAYFARALCRSFERRGYDVTLCERAEAVAAALETVSPAYAVVDLKLVGPSGLECVKLLSEHDPDMRIVVLTGFASIATAVEAIKLGACHYLAKPSNADDIEAAFARDGGDSSVALTQRPSSIKTLEWERIHETLADTGFNISETARRLGMHRRTLARKLSKRRVE